MPPAAGRSPGQVGTAAAQAQLRDILTMLNMRLAGQPEAYIVATPDLFDGEGTLRDDKTAVFLTRFLDSFAAWIAQTAQAAQAAQVK